MASSVGALWLPGPPWRGGDGGSGEARLPAIRAVAPEEASRGPRALRTSLLANITVFSFWTSSSGGRQERKQQRKLGHLYFEEGANSATEINAACMSPLLLANCLIGMGRGAPADETRACCQSNAEESQKFKTISGCLPAFKGGRRRLAGLILTTLHSGNAE